MRKVLALIITNACNFKCQTCLREYDRVTHISLEILKQTLPEAKLLGFEDAALTGGEPCLHPQFEEIVELIIQNDGNVGLVSNGSLWEKYKFLAEKYPERMLFAAFSLDGATAEINDAIRQKGSFEKVIEAIKYFVGQGIFTKLVVCLNKLNKHQIEDVTKLATDLGIKAINFSSAIKTGFNQNIVLPDLAKIQCRAEINELKNKFPKMELNTMSALQGLGDVDFCNVLNYSEGIAINPQGEAIFCCDTLRDGAVLGSLKEKSFTELYCKALSVIAELKKIRAVLIKKRIFFEGFNTCEFCNKMLEKFIQ